MPSPESIAEEAFVAIHDRLKTFCRHRGSPRAAASILKTKGLSSQWIQGFAGGQLRNPTIKRLMLLESRLAAAEGKTEQH